jgi:hypothetical protein
MVLLYHSLEENEASGVDFDGKLCVFPLVDPHCWMGCLTGELSRSPERSGGGSAPSVTRVAHDLATVASQVDAGLGPAP